MKDSSVGAVFFLFDGLLFSSFHLTHLCAGGIINLSVTVLAGLFFDDKVPPVLNFGGTVCL